MRISYDAEVDALSITFRDTTVTTKHLTRALPPITAAMASWPVSSA